MYQNKKLSARPAVRHPQLPSFGIPAQTPEAGRASPSAPFPSAAQLGTCLCTLLLAFGLVSGSWGGAWRPRGSIFPGRGC